MAKSSIQLSAVCVLAAISISACDKAQSDTPADTGKIKEAIRTDVAELVAAFNKKDAAAAVAHDAPDIVGMFHGQPNIVGAAADLEMTKAQVSDPNAYVQTGNETVDVAASGDMAVYRTTYRYLYSDPKTKKQVTEHGNWVIGYKLVDGKWKIAWNVISDTPEAKTGA